MAQEVCKAKKTFKCNLCSKELRTRQYLNRHILSKHEGLRTSAYGPKRFKCSICDFKTYMKSALLNHTRTHTNERPFKCAVVGCELTFKDQTTLRRHFKFKHSSERPFKCEFPACQFTAKILTALNQHKRVHSDDRPFACPNTGCNFRAKKRVHITSHVATVHRKIKTFACSKCEFKSARAGALEYHMACHSKTRDFECSHPTCKKSFKRPLDLQRHLSTRHGERTFGCDHSSCRKKFANVIALKKHKQTVHSEKNIACPEPECNYGTRFKSQLARHMNVHERRKESTSCSIEGCDYKGKNSEEVKEHMRRHKTIIACPETGCSQYIHTGEKLKDHTKLHNPSAGPFHCPLCFKHFRTLRSLQDHCATHTREKQFMCGYCDYATANHLQAKNHITLVHSNVRFPFIGHLMDLRECLRCKVILPSAQFLIHSMTHAAPVVIIQRLEIKWP